MLELFLKLLEKLSQLAELKGKERRAFYDDVLKPMLADFEDLHRSYLERLEGHRKFAEAAGHHFDVEKLRNEVARDILFKQHKPAAFLARLGLVNGHDELVRVLRRYVLWDDAMMGESDSTSFQVNSSLLRSAAAVFQRPNATGVFLTALDKESLKRAAARTKDVREWMGTVSEDNRKLRRKKRPENAHTSADLRQIAIQRLDVVVGELQQRYSAVQKEIQKVVSGYLKRR